MLCNFCCQGLELSVENFSYLNRMASGIRLASFFIRPTNLGCVRFQSTAAQVKVVDKPQPKSAEKGRNIQFSNNLKTV